MGFRLAPRSMTLDDRELHKFEFSVKFSGFRRFRTQQQQNAIFWQAFASRGFVSDSWAFLLDLSVNISKTVADTAKVTISD